jgi:hypothetical protein
MLKRVAAAPHSLECRATPTGCTHREFALKALVLPGGKMNDGDAIQMSLERMSKYREVPNKAGRTNI